MVGRNSITQEDLKEFSMFHNGKKIRFSRGTAYYHIRENIIYLMDYGPMTIGATYSIPTTDGDVYLEVTSCKQCGKSEFDITLETLDKDINLLQIILDGKLRNEN